MGADTFIKRFPGPRTLIDTDARKPDVERRTEHHHEEHHEAHHEEHHWKKACNCKD